MKLLKVLAIALLPIVLGGSKFPDGIKPVQAFDAQRYLGVWYEVARLDNRFERGMTRVTATYSLRDDGGLKVVNKGFLADKNQWRESEGKAYFVAGADQGYLKVTFFWPFYGDYIVFDLDEQNYQYALISGGDKSYFWLLSRTPEMDKNVQDALIKKAEALGFDMSKLVYVQQK